MSIISKESSKDQKAEEENVPQEAPPMLTPWQKENMKFMEEKGDKPKWKPIGKNKSAKKTDPLSSEAEPHLEEENQDQSEQSTKIKELPRGDSFADKLPKIKKERQKKLNRRLTLIVSVFGVATAGMIYYISPYSKLGKVTVSGTEITDQSQILKAADFQIDHGLWSQFFGKGHRGEEIVKQVPRVKTAQVSLVKLNQFKISVSEYQTVATAAQEEFFFPILENGVILTEKIPAPKDGEAVFKNFKNGQSLIDLIKVYKDLPEEIRNNIAEIAATPTTSNPNLITLQMKDGNQVIASTVDIGDKIGYYPKVASEMTENGVIDMEAGIFSYPFKKNEEKQQESTENSQN